MKYDAVKELSKTKVGNFLYGVAASIIVVLGWFGFVDEPTARLAKDARSQLQQERIELLKESNEICNKILQSPDVPMNYIGLIQNHTESKLRYDASAGAFSAAVRQVCTEAQYAEIERLAANWEEEELAAVESANISQMNPKLKERIERQILEDRLKEVANIRSLVEAANVNYEMYKENEDPQLSKAVFDLDTVLSEERTALDNLQRGVDQYKISVTPGYWERLNTLCSALDGRTVNFSGRIFKKDWDWDYAKLGNPEQAELTRQCL